MIGHLFLVDFITNPRLRKRAFFPNLMWMEKILILELGSLAACGKVLGTPQRLSKDSPLF